MQGKNSGEKMPKSTEYFLQEEVRLSKSVAWV